jgi:hypothetical protein
MYTNPKQQRNSRQGRSSSVGQAAMTKGGASVRDMHIPLSLSGAW